MKITIEDVLACEEWKTCTKCDEEKKIIFFSKRGGNIRSWCKACDAEYYQTKKRKLLEVATVKKQSMLQRIIYFIIG